MTSHETSHTSSATHTDPHAREPLLVRGAPFETASLALVLVHGRGGDALGILPIARAAGAIDAALIAPMAQHGSWYPQRFLSPFAANAPYLESALAAVDRAVQHAIDGGVPAERVILVGFSQGACLSLEYMARNGRRLGGVAALAGALIGDDADTRLDQGDLAGTPVLLACGDADEHIPVSRVRRAAAQLAEQGAAVDLRIYPGVGHVITGDQIDAVRLLIDAVRQAAKIAIP